MNIAKRGQLNISFGAIFSIIIIVATLAIAGFVIYNFVNNANKVKCGLFYDELSQKVNAIWSSDGEASLLYNGEVPSKTTKVCFGYINSTINEEEDKEAYQAFKRSSNLKYNLFFYPVNSCGDSTYRYEVKNALSQGFFCIGVNAQKASVRISKEIGGKVRICKASDPCKDLEKVIEINNPVQIDNNTETLAENSNITDYSICQKAESSSLCEGLTLALNNKAYKGNCCIEHRYCC